MRVPRAALRPRYESLGDRSQARSPRPEYSGSGSARVCRTLGFLKSTVLHSDESGMPRTRKPSIGSLVGLYAFVGLIVFPIVFEVLGALTPIDRPGGYSWTCSALLPGSSSVLLPATTLVSGVGSATSGCHSKPVMNTSVSRAG